jgi:hypothetical protein
MHKAKWTVGLSNGETLYEEKGLFCTRPGEASPWQQLQQYLAQTGLSITSLSIFMDDGRRWNLPSAGKNPKFKAFGDAAKPVSYRMFRKMGGDVMNGSVINEDRYTVAEAAYDGSIRLQTWVDESTGNSWSLVEYGEAG